MLATWWATGQTATPANTITDDRLRVGSIALSPRAAGAEAAESASSPLVARLRSYGKGASLAEPQQTKTADTGESSISSLCLTATSRWQIRCVARSPSP